MRDRLHKLIKKSRLSTNASRITDYLLAEGVIVPPCKVGDKLYAVNASQTRVNTYIVTHLEAYESGIKIYGRPIYCQTEYWMCWDADLDNDCVFRTKEDAEKALAERSKNGK